MIFIHSSYKPSWTSLGILNEVSGSFGRFISISRGCPFRKPFTIPRTPLLSPSYAAFSLHSIILANGVLHISKDLSSRTFYGVQCIENVHAGKSCTTKFERPLTKRLTQKKEKVNKIIFYQNIRVLSIVDERSESLYYDLICMGVLVCYAIQAAILELSN